MNDNPSDLAVEVVEAIQCGIPEGLIAGVVGVTPAVISDWINDRAKMTTKQRKIFRAAFSPIYANGYDYMPSDDEDIIKRAKKAYR